MNDEHPDPEESLDPTSSSYEDAKSLRARGEHASAAELLLRIGYAGEAAALFEQLFDDARALDAYDAAGDVLGALRVAIRRGDEKELQRRLRVVLQHSLVPPAVALLERTSQSAALAWLYEMTGELELAARHYREAVRPMEAARVLEQCGRLREAGEEYERALRVDGGNARAHQRLGHILARFSRYEDAIAHSQHAVQQADNPDEMICAVSTVLILSFLGLGFSTAAQVVFMKWRDAAAKLAAPCPASLDEFLSSDQAQAFAALLRRTSTPVEAPSQIEGGTSGLERTAGAFSDSQTEVLLSGRYLLGEAIGGGGVGQVFRAFDGLLERSVAVKVFGANSLGAEAVRRYALELGAVSSLQHPSIASLVEINLPSGYLVTEWIEGDSVEDALRTGRGNRWVVAMGKAVLDTLAATHRAGLVHGALKPTNILLLPSGGVTLLDFAAHHLQSLRTTETGGLANSWAYLSPAQLLGRKASAQDDLYALAAVLYRVLTGRPPFLAVGDDRSTAPPAPSSLQPELPGAWDEFLLRGLAGAPEERFADAPSMAAALPSLPASVTLPEVPDGTPDRTKPSREGHPRYRHASTRHSREAATDTYEGIDESLERPVWIIETRDSAAVEAFLVCARIPRGVQPVYDVIPAEGRVILARDTTAPVFPRSQWREVPQHLVRDLTAVAEAIEQLHAAGYALGGFPFERALGQFGPRLALAPAPLPIKHSLASSAADAASFGRLIEGVFELPPGDSESALRRLVEHLADANAIEAEGKTKLMMLIGSEERASVVLQELSVNLVASGRSRVMRRLAVNILRDSGPRA